MIFDLFVALKTKPTFLFLPRCPVVWRVAAQVLMSMNKLTRCYWNLSFKMLFKDSRLTSCELRKPFNSTGIQTLGRWEQVGLDGIVCCLSNCYTPLCSKRLLYLWGLHWVQGEGKKKKKKEEKLFSWSQTVQLRGQKLCQCRAKSSLGLNNKQKNRICQQGAKTKSTESKKRGDKEEEER